MQTVNTNTMLFLLHVKNLNFILGVLETPLVLEELKPQFIVEVNRKVIYL